MTVPYRTPRVCQTGLILAAFGLLSLMLGCSSQPPQTKPTASTDAALKRDKIKILMNWYPEAEHGGFYAAFVHGIYEKHGLDVEILPGGRSSAVTPELVLGRIQFGVGNADDVLMALSEGSNLVALMAPLQTGPRCVIVREDSGIQTLADLKNIKLEADTGRPFIPFLKQKGLLDPSIQIVPYFGSTAQIVAGPGVAQQGYSFSEPFLIEQQGVRVRNLMLADVGWNPYACCLLATDEYLAENPGIVSRVVKASIEGWQQYLRDPQKTNEYILTQNSQGMTKEALDYGVTALQSLCLPDPMPEERLGEMTSERWSTLRDQMIELKLIDGEKVKAEQAFRWPLNN